LITTCLLVLASAARGDLLPAASSALGGGVSLGLSAGAPPADLPLPMDRASTETPVTSVQWNSWSVGALQPDLLSPDPFRSMLPPSVAEAPVQGSVGDIASPRLPDSLQLLLSGLMTAGAWQVFRSARQFHFGLGQVPDWYHLEGAVQVGHSTPVGPDLCERSLDFIATCLLPDPWQLPRGSGVSLDPRPRSPGQATPCIAAPRGPPSAS
jgi:hypothetical protein